MGDTVEQSGRLADIPAGLLDVRPGGQDREAFDDGALDDLAASIAGPAGLLARPTVRPMPGGRFEIVAGERRIRAMRDRLGWSTIPVVVRDLDDGAAAAAQLAENVGRVDLDPIEEARAMVRLVDAGSSVAEVARTAGVSESRVRARLPLVGLVDDVAHYVRRRLLPLGYAAHLTTLDANRQRLALRAFHEDRPTLEVFARLCDRMRADQAAEGMALLDADAFLTVAEWAAEATAEVRAELAVPVVREELVDVESLARAAGVKRATVHQWQTRRVLPPADVTVSGRPAWWASTVDRFLAGRARPCAQPPDPASRF